MTTTVAERFTDLINRFSAAIDGVFGRPLQVIFHPTNRLLSAVPQPVWTVCAVGLFIIAMLWVWLGLRKEYVNLDAPSKHWYHDLRWWTILSMLPHVIVYIYF